jgi:hypothetical protein
MANDCSNKLIVLGLQCAPQEFTGALEVAMYGEEVDEGEYYAVHLSEDRPEQFLFKTRWEPPVKVLLTLSKRHPAAVFLLDYLCWESGYRGQVVIRDGEVIERVHREGYNGPGYLWSDITHPLTSLFSPYLQNTLASRTAQRLKDAIAIVSGLKRTLEDNRFTESHYRQYGDSNAVAKALVGLTEMLSSMTAQAQRVSFEGALLEDLDAEQRLILQERQDGSLEDIENL